MKISECETVTDYAKFYDVYKARCQAVYVLSEGVIERMEQYNIMAKV